MLKTKRVVGFLFFLSVMSTAVVFAQNPQIPQQQQEQIEVSDEELSEFAEAFQGIRMINQQAQQEMATVVQEGGMEIKRFNEIHEATLNPAVEVEATEEEKEQHKEIASGIEDLQETYQGKMEEVIEDTDMTVQRYQQIATSLQTDPELQERLRAQFQD